MLEVNRYSVILWFRIMLIAIDSILYVNETYPNLVNMTSKCR